MFNFKSRVVTIVNHEDRKCNLYNFCFLLKPNTDIDKLLILNVPFQNLFQFSVIEKVVLKVDVFLINSIRVIKQLWNWKL